MTSRQASPFGEFDHEIRTDELGIRVPLASEQSSARADRNILVIGDTVAVAYEILYAETSAAKVEKALQAAGHNLRVLNAGIHGYWTEQSCKRMMALLGHAEFGVTDVVYVFSLNNPFENMSLHFPKRRMSKPGAYLDEGERLNFRTLDYPVGIFDADALFVDPGGAIGTHPLIGRGIPSRRVIENKIRYKEPKGVLENLYLVQLAKIARDNFMSSKDLKGVRAQYPYTECIGDSSDGFPAFEEMGGV